MVDLKPVLLRDTQKYTYGATLQHIIPLIKRGNEMDTKRLVIVLNGEMFEPIEYNEMNFQFVNNTLTVDIKTQDIKEKVKEAEKVDEPLADGFVALNVTTSPFELQGDDLDAFNALSAFRDPSRTVPEIENGVKHTTALESDVYNIQDMMSVNSAILDLVGKEEDLLMGGCQIFKASTPVYAYISDNDFKLVENVVFYDNKPGESNVS